VYDQKVFSNQLQAAVFDYGGVMAKSPFGRVEMLAAEYKAEKEIIMQLFFGDSSSFESPWFDAECGIQPLNEVFAQRMQLIFDEHDLLFNLDFFKSWVIDAINEPDPVMEELVINLKASGIKVALLTNSVPEFWPVIEKTINTEVFDCIIDSSKVGLRKPDLKIYELVAKELGLDTTSCLMIDDLAHNVIGAESAGMKSVLFSTSEETSKNILRYFNC
jgi:epoxide hydrolase-like predicted phosphatase|tara:strand:- start:38161 stop:38814 length:654 start_codon:yes stop_codon:yes gene_type:complete